MDAIIMPSTLSLLDRLKSEYPEFTFQESDVFRWSPDTNTLFIDVTSPDFSFFTLHELGHALLGHTSYERDIDLLKIERDAWHYAATHLSVAYDVEINDERVQDNLDTYREWLHTRSKCPSCNMTGLQTAYDAYLCLACGCHWRTNEARSCALRRYTTS